MNVANAVKGVLPILLIPFNQAEEEYISRITRLILQSVHLISVTVLIKLNETSRTSRTNRRVQK